jgi:hypothetical protein
MASVRDEVEPELEAAELQPPSSHDEEGCRSKTPTQRPAISPHLLLLSTVSVGSLCPRAATVTP